MPWSPGSFHKMRKTVVQEAAGGRVVLLTLDPWGQEEGWVSLPFLDQSEASARKVVWETENMHKAACCRHLMLSAARTAANGGRGNKKLGDRGPSDPLSVFYIVPSPTDIQSRCLPPFCHSPHLL